jgi:outer membrane cobalamin receptor
MTKKTSLFLFLVFIIQTLSAANLTISGFITDQTSGETLLNGSVYDFKSGKGSVSNVYGFYSLSLPAGMVEVRCSYVGFRTQTFSFRLSKDTTLNIKLQPTTELNTVTVYGGSSRREFGVLGAQMGAIEVPISQIKSIPALFGETDVLKALQLLPGVQGGTEGSAGLYVRGGGPDENLLLLDGVPVYNVNHMGGFFSIFNADALKNVTLYKGNFPARFSSRLSSVIDIRMNDGNAKQIHGNFSVGVITSKFNLEGPLIKDKTTFNISYRRTYGDLIIKPAIWYAAKKENNTNNYSAGYYFYDLNAKITHKISDTDKLFLSLYSGDDAIDMSIKDNYSSGGQDGYNVTTLGMKWGNMISAFRWNHIINSKLFMNTTASYTRYRFNMLVGNENKYKSLGDASYAGTDIEIGYLSGISDYAMRTDFDYTPLPGHDVKFGASYTNHTFRPGVSVFNFSVTQGTTASMDTTIGDKNVNGHEVNMYVEDNLSVGPFLKANVGVNYSMFQVQGQFYHSLEPRLSMRLLMSDKLSFKAGYASMSQYIHMLSNSNLSMPTDLWVPVTKRIEPMDSKQYSVGLFYNLNDVVDFSIESYYKSMDNLIEYKDGAGFMGSSTGWEDKVNMGRGWSYGIEFLAQKTVGKTTGWLAYTWSKAERKFDKPGQEINFGNVFPAKYDRRHNISLTMNHKFNERFDLSGTWVYYSGNCGTLALQQYKAVTIPDIDIWQNLPTIDYISERNNYRLPAYHRMDIGFNWHKIKKHGVRTWNISLYNAYNQKNPFIVRQSYSNDWIYNPDTNTYDSRKIFVKTSIFPIIPSISYSYKF